MKRLVYAERSNNGELHFISEDVMKNSVSFKLLRKRVYGDPQLLSQGTLQST